MGLEALIAMLFGDLANPKIPGIIYAKVSSVDNGEYMLTPRSGALTVDIGPARLATMMTGDQFGSFFAPCVGDEVVVGFELGNVQRPVILGSLWNPDKKPPEKA